MSLIRLPTYRSRSAGGRPIKPDRKPKKSRKKAWDDSVHDLSVYRATAEEQERRRVVHQSQNVGAVKQDQLKRRIIKAKKNGNSSDSRRNALMKEVLFNHSQLEDVLARSDQVMAVVKDLFGDDPRKYRGLPRITVAPNSRHDHSGLPGVDRNEQPSKLDALSESMMDKTALNDLQFEDSADEEEWDEEEELAYRPVLDFDRFQKFLQEEQAKVQTENKNGAVTQSVAAKAMEQILQMAYQAKGNQEASPDDSHVGAINDTAKVKRTMARTNQENVPVDDAGEDEEEQTQQSAPQNQPSGTQVGLQYYIPADPSPEDLLHLQSLKTILDDLNGRMSEYECSTGRNPPAQRLTAHTVSSYLLAVADNVSRLFNYLRQSELRLKAETTLREQLGQDVFFLKNLVDTLTEDIIASQEEHAKLKLSFVRFQQQHVQDIAQLREELINNGIHIQQSVQPLRAASVPLDNESVTMEDLAAHMQNTLRMANMVNTENLTSAVVDGPQLNYQSVRTSSQDAGTFHSAYRQSNQGSIIHIPQPVHPSQMHQNGQGQLDSIGQQAFTSVQIQNSSDQIHSQGRPVPVFYSDSVTNGYHDGPKDAIKMKTVPPQAAQLLSPPKQCDSPKIPAGKYEVGVQQIQQVVQSLKASKGRDTKVLPTNQFAGLGHFHDVSGISSSVISTRPPLPPALQPSAATVTVKKEDEMTTREMLQMQIAELNRQHAEAQQRIKVLYKEQQKFQNDDDQELVSPPISPIPPASESEAASDINQAASTTNSNSSKILAGRGMRGITVSLPQVEHLVQSPDTPHYQQSRREVFGNDGAPRTTQTSR